VFTLLVIAAAIAFVASMLVARPASAMCRPGSLTLLPKPSFEPPRCEPYPG
jgi:hypothetical protein